MSVCVSETVVLAGKIGEFAVKGTVFLGGGKFWDLGIVVRKV
jgi:hypothetical protein